MVTGISGVTDYVDTTQETTSMGKNLGRDTFIRLFLTQLQNQDPLNPLDATEMSAQLAQFSSLEQLFNINENMETLIAYQDTSYMFQGLDMIGKEIETNGDIISLGDSGTASGSFTLGSYADCAAVISDEYGNVIKTIDLGSLEAGDHAFVWDGTDQDGDEVTKGVYDFQIIAEGSAGEAVTVDTRIRGIVDRVSLGEDMPVLYIGTLPVPLSLVTDVILPED